MLEAAEKVMYHRRKGGAIQQCSLGRIFSTYGEGKNYKMTMCRFDPINVQITMVLSQPYTKRVAFCPFLYARLNTESVDHFSITCTRTEAD